MMKSIVRLFSGSTLALLLGLVSSQALAMPVYTFSFEANGPNYSGPISGSIFGLAVASEEILLGQEASSVVINAVPGFFGDLEFSGDLGSKESPGPALANSFDVDGGSILRGLFIGFDNSMQAFLCLAGGVAPDTVCSNPDTAPSSFLGFGLGPGEVFDGGAATITAQPVPAPAPAMMLAIGLLILRLHRSSQRA